jgi:uncharacterized repeat protein (TIGR01451 family)
MINCSTQKTNWHQQQHHRRLLIISILGATFLLIFVFGTLLAQEGETDTADLSNSELLVSDTEASPGDLINYQIIVSNTGGISTGVVLTDTLPGGLTIVSDSLSITDDRGSYQLDNHILTWSDTVFDNEQLEIGFNALISESLQSGTELSNTVEISGAGTRLTLNASTTIITGTLTVVTDTSLYFPLMRTPLPIPVLSLVNPTDMNNNWTIGWSPVQFGGVFQYEVQEDTDPDFTNPQSTILSSSTTSMNVNKSASWKNLYLYRVRVITNNLVGSWSNTLYVVGNYEDNFNDPNSGWILRREDTDTTNNSTFYEDGNFVHRMKSGWDSMIGGPLMPAPQPPYRIESRIQLQGRDNLHAYGLVFGGDWDGTLCPNNDFTSCYNQYYRLLVLWFGNNDELKYQLKRITSHDEDNGHGRGGTLIGFREVQVNQPSGDWQVWSVEVHPNGDIKIFVNGNQVGETKDTALIDKPYFGSFSAVDEYTGLRAEYDWYKVTSMQP